MADVWDQFPDHPATAAADPWAQFPDHPAVSAPAPSYSGPNMSGVSSPDSLVKPGYRGLLDPKHQQAFLAMHNGDMREAMKDAQASGWQIQPDWEQQYHNQTDQAPQSFLGNTIATGLNTLGEAGGNALLQAYAKTGLPGAERASRAAQAPTPIPYDPSGVSGFVGRMAGGIPKFVNPVVAGVSGAAEKFGELENQKAQGADFSGLSEAGNIVGTGLIDAAMAQIFGGKAQGNIERAVSAKLASRVPELVSRYGVKGALGYLINEGQGVATDLLTQQTTDPNQQILANVNKGRGLLGAAQNIGVGAVHDYFKAPTPTPTPTPTEIPLAPAAEPTLTHQPTWDRGRPQVPPEVAAGTNADVVKWAGENGFETQGLENLGRKPLMSALDSQRIQQKMPESTQIARESSSLPPQLPPEAASWDAGALGRFARRNGYTVDQTRFQSDIKNGMKPRDAVRKQIEEQYGNQKGVGPTQGLEQPNDVATRVLGRNRQADTSSIPLTDTYRLAGETTEYKPPEPPPEPTRAKRPISAPVEIPQTTETLAQPGQRPRLPNETDAQYAERQALTVSTLTDKAQYDEMANNPPNPGGPPLTEPASGPLKEHLDSVLGKSPAEAAAPAPEDAVAADEQPVLDAQKELSGLRSQLKSDSLTGEAKTVAEKRVDSLAADVQNKIDQFSQKHGDDAGETLFEKLQSLISDEEGGTRMFHTFAERKVLPAIENVAGNTAETVKKANAFFGMGLDSKEATGIKGEVLSLGGNLDRRRAAVDALVRPGRDVAEKLPQDQRDALVDGLASGKVTDPALKKASDVIRTAQANLKSRAAAIGENVSGWSDDHIGRLFVDAKTGKIAGQRSIAGPEGYRKGPQNYATYAEAKAAAAKIGLKPLYDNPVEMAMAKVSEADRSISARELVDKRMKTPGSVTDLKPGMKLPDGYAYLDDKLAKQGGTRLIAPEAEANVLNQMIAPGLKPGIPILENIIQAKRNLASLNFALSAFHIPVEASRNMGAQIGLAVNNLVNVEFGLAAKNLGRALPWRQVQFGSLVRKAALDIGQSSPLEPVVKAITDAGGRLNTRSILKPTAWESMIRDYKANDVLSATGNLIRAAGDVISKPIMEAYVPNIKAGYEAALAETAISRGLKGEELASFMRKGVDNADNVLGQVVRENKFEHRISQDIFDGLFSAPEFAKGDVRGAGSFARDTLKGLYDLAHGKKPEMTPAMQTVLGHAITTATLGAATQISYTLSTTGKVIWPTGLKDYFMPRTGRKNADGSDERIMLPTGFSLAASVLTEGPQKTIANRISPVFRALYDVAVNSDYKNTQVRDPNASVATQAGQSAKHVGKAMLPFSVSNMIDKPTGEEQTTDLKVGGFLGVRKASPRLSQSPAEQLAHQFAYGDVPPKAKTPEEETRYGAKRTLEQAFRKHDPKVGDKIAAALKDGTLVRSDVADARKRAAEPQGLLGVVKSGSLTTDQAMQVWEKASPDERKLIRYSVRKKVAEDDKKSEKEKTALFTALSAS